MAYQMVATTVTLNDLEGHSPLADVFKCNPSNICVAFYTISTDTVLAWFLCISRASCWHSDTLALRTERQSARMSKIKNSGLDQYGAEPRNQWRRRLDKNRKLYTAVKHMITGVCCSEVKRSRSLGADRAWVGVVRDSSFCRNATRRQCCCV